MSSFCLIFPIPFPHLPFFCWCLPAYREHRGSGGAGCWAQMRCWGGRGGRKRISLRERDFFLCCLEMLSQQSAGKKLFLTGQIIKRWGVLVVWKSDLWLAPERGTEPEQNPNKVAFLLYKQCTRKRMDELGKQLKCSQGKLFCAIEEKSLLHPRLQHAPWVGSPALSSAVLLGARN